MRLVLFHAIHLLGSLALMVLPESMVLRLIGAVLFFFAQFTLMHDAAHGSLKLTRTINDVILSLAAAFVGVSGHAIRQLHMRHHLNPFGPGDLLGLESMATGVRLLSSGGRAWLALKADRSLRPGDASTRRLEWVLVAVLLGAAMITPVLRLYAVVVTVGQLTIPIWADRIPHHAPRWLLRVASVFAEANVELAVNLVHHQLHHRFPKVPTCELPEVARGQCAPVGEVVYEPAGRVLALSHAS